MFVTVWKVTIYILLLYEIRNYGPTSYWYEIMEWKAVCQLIGRLEQYKEYEALNCIDTKFWLADQLQESGQSVCINGQNVLIHNWCFFLYFLRMFLKVNEVFILVLAIIMIQFGNRKMILNIWQSNPGAHVVWRKLRRHLEI